MFHLFFTMKKCFYLYLLAVSEVFTYLPYPELPNFRLLWPLTLFHRKKNNHSQYDVYLYHSSRLQTLTFKPRTHSWGTHSLILTANHNYPIIQNKRRSLSLFMWSGISIQFLVVDYYSLNMWLSSSYGWFYWNKSGYKKKNKQKTKNPKQKIQYSQTKTSIFSLHNSMMLLNHGPTYPLIFLWP